MNEKILYGQEMKATNLRMNEIIQRIMENAIYTRPEKAVCYRPYEVCEGVGYIRALGAQRVDLNVRYPDAKIGDGVFSEFHI